MGQQNLKNALINWDLVTVNPKNKNWDWKDLFCFWGVSIQSVIGFSLITSLYIVYDLNTFVVLFGTIIGSLLVCLFSNLIGKPSQKFGLPFIVLLRSSLGIYGAKYFGLIRLFVGIFMFGIQTYFLSKAFGYLISLAIFNYNPELLEQKIFLTFFLGLSAIDWLSIIITIFFQGFLFSIGMNFNRKIINFSAITVYFGMMIFFFTVLLNDVKFTVEAFQNVLNFKNFTDKNNFVPLLSVASTTFAYFSIVILSFGDFSRYARDEIELKKGNLSLILNLLIFSFFSLFIVSGIDAFSKVGSENLSKVLTDPTEIIGKIDNILITCLAIIFILISSLSTNLIANFIPSQYTLINFVPSRLSLKSSSFLIAFFGFLVGIFWLTYLSQIGILSFIDTFGAFLGPLFGLMISDFYLIQKQSLANKDVYSLENNGKYYYSGGWHIKGLYSVILGFIFSASTIWNANMMFLQSFSWILGAIVSSIVYYLLARK